MFFNYLYADLKKTKRLSMRAAHIVIPIGTAAVFLVYYLYSRWNVYTKVEAYYQVLGIGFPFLTGLFSAELSNQELSAGAFQNMLSVPKRSAAFFSKLSVLLLYGMAATLLASVIFGTVYFFLYGQRDISYLFYWAAAFVLMGSNILVYVYHLFFAMRFNKGVTIGLGIFESLLSALMLTGVGDGVWELVPAAWASGFVSRLLLLPRFASYDIIITDWKPALFICAVATAGGLLAFGVWSCHWSGIKGYD